MTNKKLLSTMLSLMATVIVLFALGGITVFADETDEPQSDIIASGYCGAEGNGENLSWTLDSKGLLTISGTGEMRNARPSEIWKEYKDVIQEVSIIEGVTSIGDFAFTFCTSLKSITIPDSVTNIGDDAFVGCSSLKSITIPDSVTSIGDSAFTNCSSLTSITIPNSVKRLGADAFSSCSELTKIYLEVAPEIVKDNLSFLFTNWVEAIVYVPDEYYAEYASLFSSFENNFLVNTSDSVSSGVPLYGYSLSLDGSIGVNFYMKLSEPVLKNIDTAYMEFTVNGKKQQVAVRDATIKDGYYIFRCDVVAKEMADEITAQVYLSEGNPIGNAYTYSVRDYAVYILDHSEKYSPNAIEMVKAMLNYGAASQKYFNYNTGNLANSVLSEVEQQSGLSTSSLTCYNAGDISPEKISLSLKSTITMKLYFKTEDIADITSFEYKNNKLSTNVSGDYTIVIIEGIPATNFAGRYTIKCYVNGSTTDYKTIKISPSNYAYIVLHQPNGGVITDDLKNVVSALYQFSVAAYEYNAVQPV